MTYTNDMNLILTGFMGTGKSTIGQIVADQLNRPFVDMDTEIERQTDQTIPAIFANQGEAAFRQLEKKLCQALASRRNLVIATGGGALVDAANRAIMRDSGLIICLTATPESLVERLQDDNTRPLLKEANPANRIRDLLAQREAAYAALPHHIDTSTQTPAETAEAVLQLWHTQFT
jgi:shikimate kinase